MYIDYSLHYPVKFHITDFFVRYGIPVMDAGFGKGVGPVYLSSVDCNGDEADLLNCTFTRATCNHDQDAGVKCGKVMRSYGTTLAI